MTVVIDDRDCRVTDIIVEFGGNTDGTVVTDVTQLQYVIIIIIMCVIA